MAEICQYQTVPRVHPRVHPSVHLKEAAYLRAYLALFATFVNQKKSSQTTNVQCDESVHSSMD